MELSKSFTLIELLVVIAIIGILAGTIIVTMSGATDKATIAKSQSFASSVRSALGAGMVSEYRFDGTGVAEGSSATSAYYVDTWGGHNGTATNNPTVLTGANCVSDSCLNFDGDSSQCIHVTDNPSFSFGSEMSAMVWTKEMATNDTQPIASQMDSLLWQFYFSGGPGFHLYNGDDWRDTFPDPAIGSDNKWHLIGYTFNDGESKLYFDGEVVQAYIDDDDDINSVYDPAADLTIGCRNDFYFSTGKIDDLQLYNKAIPTAQIKATYYAGLNKLLANKQITDEEYFTRISKLEQHSASK